MWLVSDAMAMKGSGRKKYEEKKGSEIWIWRGAARALIGRAGGQWARGAAAKSGLVLKGWPCPGETGEVITPEVTFRRLPHDPIYHWNQSFIWFGNICLAMFSCEFRDGYYFQLFLLMLLRRERRGGGGGRKRERERERERNKKVKRSAGCGD